jgi:hypothetical protein
MGIRITVPWLNRSHTHKMSAPEQSVTMHEDDLDHLEALHRAMATGTRRKNRFHRRHS